MFDVYEGLCLLKQDRYNKQTLHPQTCHVFVQFTSVLMRGSPSVSTSFLSSYFSPLLYHVLPVYFSLHLSLSPHVHHILFCPPFSMESSLCLTPLQPSHSHTSPVPFFCFSWLNTYSHPAKICSQNVYTNIKTNVNNYLLELCDKQILSDGIGGAEQYNR